MYRAAAIVLTSLLLACGRPQSPQEAIDQLAPSMTFYASYEDGMDAAQARDDRRIYSAPSYEALGERGPWYWGQDVQLAYDSGISGHALNFTGGLTQALFYTGEANAPWADAGALSVWLHPGEFFGAPLAVVGVDPLAPAVAIDLLSDPLQLAVRAIHGEGSAVPPAGDWLHVVISVSDAASGGKVTVYVNGQESTTFDVTDPDHSWDAARSTIRLGVDYVGLIDELAIFDRALTPAEVRLLHETPNLPASLMR
ncbi:MAG: hypothetical protein O3A53_01170 [Acidobacteria bacterium]|nr:hypothetical protein [Acidobacteriota bacterium]MDA1233392.1 hypothetical protein [Acidobacteriota bacterium]